MRLVLPDHFKILSMFEMYIVGNLKRNNSSTPESTTPVYMKVDLHECAQYRSPHHLVPTSEFQNSIAY